MMMLMTTITTTAIMMMRTRINGHHICTFNLISVAHQMSVYMQQFIEKIS